MTGNSQFRSFFLHFLAILNTEDEILFSKFFLSGGYTQYLQALTNQILNDVCSHTPVLHLFNMFTCKNICTC